MSRRRLAVLLVATTLVVAACGAADVLAPRLAVREAARETVAQERTRVSLSLVGEDAAILALFNEGEPRSADDVKGLELLRQSRLTITTERTGGRFGLDMQIGDVEHAFELRLVDDTLYFRGDAPGLAEVFGTDLSDVEAMVAEAREAGFGFVGDVVAGRWLAADMSRFEEMGDEVDDTQRSLFLDAITETWGQDVAVERLDGDRYRLSVPIRRIYEHLLPALGSLPGFPGAGMIPPADQVPDTTVSTEIWVSDGKISRVELDLAQFSETSAGRVALRLDVSSPDSRISAPDGAADIDLYGIFESFFAQFSGAMTTS